MSDDQSANSRKSDRRRERAEQAARLIAEQKRREQRSRLARVGVTGLAVAIVIAICVFVGIEKSGGSGNLAAKYAKAGTSQYSLTVGDPNAPHKVVMYEDFLCPYCDAFELAGGTQLQKLASEGKVYLDYRPFHLLSEKYSSQALNAWVAVLKTAGPTAALQFHNLLYREQPSEQDPKIDDGTYPADQKLIALAVQAGADKSKITGPIDNMTYQSWVDDATNQAMNDEGVQSTPTVILDGKRFTKGANSAQLAADLIKAVSK